MEEQVAELWLCRAERRGCVSGLAGWWNWGTPVNCGQMGTGITKEENSSKKNSTETKCVHIFKNYRKLLKNKHKMRDSVDSALAKIHLSPDVCCCALICIKVHQLCCKSKHDILSCSPLIQTE